MRRGVEAGTSRGEDVEKGNLNIGKKQSASTMDKLQQKDGAESSEWRSPRGRRRREGKREWLERKRSGSLQELMEKVHKGDRLSKKASRVRI